MAYIKCPTEDCPNYILDTEELCPICLGKKSHVDIPKVVLTKTAGNTNTRDKNKERVENVLLPILRKLKPESLEVLLDKTFSKELFNLQLPLLVECRQLGESACLKEIITDKSGVYRYYKKPYEINGKKYHICSQWWGGSSKDVLYRLKAMSEE